MYKSDELLKYKFWCENCVSTQEICLTAITYSKTRVINCKTCGFTITSIQENYDE